MMYTIRVMLSGIVMFLMCVEIAFQIGSIGVTREPKTREAAILDIGVAVLVIITVALCLGGLE